MFGKKDGFKYEVEVKALIREATEGLNQRIFALEMQNNQLIQRSQALEGEIYQLKNGLCNDFARLEKRITDFTDVWHPMMTANINRIKADLETTIMEAEREDIKKVQVDLESKMEQNITKIKTTIENEREDIKKIQSNMESKMFKIVEENENFIIIGHYKNKFEGGPIIVSKYKFNNTDFNQYINNNILDGRNCGDVINHPGKITFYLNQLKKISNIKSIDLKNFGNIELETGEILTTYILFTIMNNTFTNNELGPTQRKMIETLLQFTNDTGIKLYFNNSEFNQQGVSIKQLLENIITKYK